jgi:hypothetical protein
LLKPTGERAYPGLKRFKALGQRLRFHVLSARFQKSNSAFAAGRAGF